MYHLYIYIIFVYISYLYIYHIYIYIYIYHICTYISYLYIYHVCKYIYIYKVFIYISYLYIYIYICVCVPGAAAGQELSVCRILFVDCCLLCRRRSENHDSAHMHGRMNLPEPSGSSKGRTGSSCSAIFPTPQLARGSSKRL